MYYLYILKCSDNSLYTGITNDLGKRFKIHSIGKGSKYVKSRCPFVHVYTESFLDRSSAQVRESKIKSWTRDQKIKNLNLTL